MTNKPLYKTQKYKIDENNSIDVNYIDGQPWISAEDMAKMFGTTTEEVERLINESFENFELDPNAVTRVLPVGVGEKMTKEENSDDILSQILEKMGYEKI